MKLTRRAPRPWAAAVSPAQGGDASREAGMSTLEVVLWTPIIVFVLMMLAAFGLMVDAQGVVDGAASDAARMGSLQRDPEDALLQAENVAATDTGSLDCTDNGDGTPAVNDEVGGVSSFAAGQLYTVTVTCTVDVLGLYHDSVVSVSVAPVDTYREAG